MAKIAAALAQRKLSSLGQPGDLWEIIDICVNSFVLSQRTNGASFMRLFVFFLALFAFRDGAGQG